MILWNPEVSLFGFVDCIYQFIDEIMLCVISATTANKDEYLLLATLPFFNCWFKSELQSLHGLYQTSQCFENIIWKYHTVWIPSFMGKMERSAITCSIFWNGNNYPEVNSRGQRGSLPSLPPSFFFSFLPPILLSFLPPLIYSALTHFEDFY